MHDTIGILLAGGHGTRLAPLTLIRAKPAVPFGGKWIIADFTIGSMYNSGISRIKVLAQYISQPLIQHIRRSWPLTPNGEQYVEVIPAQMRVHGDWYRGTADAVYQNMDVICPRAHCYSFAAIFAADHVFKIDVRQMRASHQEHNADFTVCVMEMPVSEAALRFGVVEVEADGRIVGFEEKPKVPKEISSKPGFCYVSMGNYLASIEYLAEVLHEDAKKEASSHDFGKDVIPTMVCNGGRVFAYNFFDNKVAEQDEPYWVDVGTIEAYWKANIDLAGPHPKLNLYSEEWEIMTPPDQLPPAKYGDGGSCEHTILSGGCLINGGYTRMSVLGRRVKVHHSAHVDESVLFSGVEIGKGSEVRRAIIDEYVKVPPGIRIGFSEEEDKKRGMKVVDGITVVPHGYLFK